MFIKSIRLVTETVKDSDGVKLIKLSKNLILPLFEHNKQKVDSEDMVKCIAVIVVKDSVEVLVESPISRYSTRIFPVRQGTTKLYSLKEENSE